jgi:[ribosomal protein S18]-alanine N-acetyltransferase
MRPVTLRAGNAGDLAAVMAVMTAAFEPHYREAWSELQCRAMLDSVGTWLVLAEVDGVAAGFALGRTVLDDGELLLLAVAPGHRRQGIAATLITGARRMASAAGAKQLHLEVRDGNAAMALYERTGFSVIGRRPGYYRLGDGTRRDAITLQARLPEK